MYTDVHTQYLCSRKPNLNVLSHSFTGKRISATTAEIFGVHLAERHMYVHDNYLIESLLNNIEPYDSFRISRLYSMAQMPSRTSGESTSGSRVRDWAHRVCHQRLAPHLPYLQYSTDLTLASVRPSDIFFVSFRGHSIFFYLMYIFFSTRMGSSEIYIDVQKNRS